MDFTIGGELAVALNLHPNVKHVLQVIWVDTKKEVIELLWSGYSPSTIKEIPPIVCTPEELTKVKAYIKIGATPYETLITVFPEILEPTLNTK